VSRVLALVIGALVLALAVTACGGGDDKPGSGGGGGGKALTLDWDLSGSHTMDDVHWPAGDRDIDAVNLRPIASLRFTFPGGHVFRETGKDVLRVGPFRKGRTVEEITLVSHPETVDGAYALSTRWARELGIPTKPLERWHDAGGTARNVVAYDTHNTRLGDGGPVPSLKLIASFDDAKPVSVTLSFFWPRAGD
jgi:hypothetical protein